MRKIKEILRLRLLGGITGARRIGLAVGCGKTAVAECLQRAAAAGLTSWETVAGLDEDRELVAAEAGDGVGRAHGRLQPPRRIQSHVDPPDPPRLAVLHLQQVAVAGHPEQVVVGLAPRAHGLAAASSARDALGSSSRVRPHPFERSRHPELMLWVAWLVLRANAKPAIAEAEFPVSQPGTPYLAPQLLLNADHSMPVMKEEIFGPVAGLMKVSSDEQAIALMNDTAFGLTAAIWTGDDEAALDIGERVETGTWFMNRCDYLDPALAWVGVKDSGRGCTLSVVGYEHLTRPKSFHLRTRI